MFGNEMPGDQVTSLPLNLHQCMHNAKTRHFCKIFAEIIQTLLILTKNVLAKIG